MAVQDEVKKSKSKYKLNINGGSISQRARKISKVLSAILYCGIWSLPATRLITIINSLRNGSKLNQLYSDILQVVGFLLVAIFFQFILEVIVGVFEWFIVKLDHLKYLLISHTIASLERISHRFGLSVKRLWLSLLSDFQGKYYKALKYLYRDYRTEGFWGSYSTLPLDKVFIPLQVSRETLDHVSSVMIGTHLPANHLSPGSMQIWDFLISAKKEPAYLRLAILGPPGSGKTTLLKNLTLAYATGTYKQQNKRVPQWIPVLIYLRDIQILCEDGEIPNLPELINKDLEHYHHKLPLEPQWFESRLKAGLCLVMLDGLDEVADVKYRNIINHWISCQMDQYPESLFIITSRPFGYRDNPIKQISTILAVQPFDLKQVTNFLGKWYRQTEIMSRAGNDDPGVIAEARRQADDLVYRIRRHPALGAMSYNPLLLSMIATVHRFRGALPGRRVELYEEICNILLGRRQEAKRIPDKLTLIQKKAVLQLLALKLMLAERRDFTAEAGKTMIHDKWITVASDSAMTANDFFQQIANITGLLVEIEQGIYEFAHHSFQEYLAATQIKDSSQATILLDKVNKPWWLETIKLYAVQALDATDVIKAALSESTRLSLTLAYDCLQEQASIQPVIRNHLERKFREGLESTDPEIFKLAAEIKLLQRLNNLSPINKEVYVDVNFISCAEYQLFLDEGMQSNRCYRPDHWNSNRFPKGQALEPIRGIRAIDAEKFCKWLNNRYPHVGFCYRLPAAAEIENHSVDNPSIACWSESEYEKSLKGIQPKQFHAWKYLLFDINDSSFIDANDVDRAKELARCLSLSIDAAYKIANIKLDARKKNQAFAEIKNSLFLHRPKLDDVRNQAQARDYTYTIIKILSKAESLNLNFQGVISKASTLTRGVARGTISSSGRISESIEEIFDLLESSYMQLREHDSHLLAKQKSDLDRYLSMARSVDIAFARGKHLSLSRDLTDEMDIMFLRDRKRNMNQILRLLKEHTLELKRALRNEKSFSIVDDNDVKKCLAFLRERVLEREQILVQETTFVRSYLLFIFVIWDQMIGVINRRERKHYLNDFLNNERNVRRKKLDEYDGKRNNVFKAYMFFAVLDARKAGKIPAWEGIRIAKERVLGT